MATTYTPSSGDASYPSFAGVAFDDPRAYSAHDNKVVSAKYFLKPVQDELLKHQQILAESTRLQVSNKTGGTLTAGTLVYVSAYDSATNSLPEVSKADADSQVATHVVVADIADGATGEVAAAAEITGLDTSTLVEDDVLYLSTTAGGYTKTAPTGDNAIVQRVGIVQVVDAVNGEIFFHPGFAVVEKPAPRQKVNLSATAAPTVTDDSAAGYAVGSRWIDVTNDVEYVCLDATAGAAVWTETTQTGGGTALPVDDTTSLVQDPVDNTKQTRLDTGAVATGTVRTITMPDQDVDLTPDATFKGATSAPTAHAASHLGGGSDAISAATTSVDGLMSAADKTKLDGVEAGADVTDAANVDAAGAVMDSDFAGTQAGHMRRTGAGTYEVIKDNLTAGVAPTVTDDSAAGYAVDSRWIDVTNDKAYICVDATAGAAVWVEITQAGGGAALPVDDTTSLVQDPTDNTKQTRIDTGAVATGTVRTITMPDQDVDLTPNTGTFPGATHASRHTDGTDDIQDATSSQKGLMTAAYAGKLDMLFCKNALINGDARVKQANDYNATVLDTWGMGVDMWKNKVYAASGTLDCTFTRDTAASVGRTGYAHKCVVTTAPSGSEGYWRYRMDAKTAARFEGQAMTFSCLVRHDAAGDKNFTITVRRAGAADDFTTPVDLKVGTATAVSSGVNTQLTLSLTSAETANAKYGLEIEIKFEIGPISGFNYWMTEAQLEEGATATDFERRNYEVENSMVRRWYELFSVANGAWQLYTNVEVGQATTTTRAYFVFHYFPKARTPVLSESGGGVGNHFRCTDATGSVGTVGANGLTFAVIGQDRCRMYWDADAAHFTAGDATWIAPTYSAAWIEVDATL